MERLPPVVGTVLLVYLLCAALSPVAADPSPVDVRIDELEKAYRDAFDGLFRWCRGKGLHATAATVARELLREDVDHQEARRWLGYRRREGVWVRPKHPSTRKDRNRIALREYPARRAAMLERLASQYEALLCELDDAAHAGAKRRLLDLALRRWPDRAVFRSANGQVRWRGRWVLPESPKAAKRHLELEELARTLLREAHEATPCEVPTHVRALPLRLRAASRCRHVTVVSTRSLDEASNVARYCVAAEGLFQRVFALETVYAEDVVVVLGRGPIDVPRVVSSLPLPTHAKREMRQLVGFWLPTLAPVLLEASHTEEDRLDGTLRLMLDSLLRRAFGEFGRIGWASDGIGTYLTWLLCGTRLTTLSQGRARTDSTDADKPDSAGLGDHWLGLAQSLAKRDELPELVYLVSVNLNKMSRADVLGAYAFAVYLIAGRSQEVTPFLRASHAGKDTAAAASEALGLELPALDARWRQWLSEVPARRRPRR